METAFKTDCGKIREHNEDSGGLFYSKTGQLLALVADGMGGHRAGDVASALALDFIKGHWEKTAEAISHAEAEHWLQETIKQANKHLLSYAGEHPECRGMGTTIVATLCMSEFAAIAHVGDSRCYLLEESGLTQVTKDHSLVNELVRQGEISEEEAAVHPRKHVLLQALGTEETVESETKMIEWRSGNIVLLCSDGLTNNVSDEQLKDTLSSGLTLQEKADSLIEQANAAGGDDNITLVLVQADSQEVPLTGTRADNDAAENGSGTDKSPSTTEESG